MPCTVTLRNQNRFLPLFYPVVTLRENESGRGQSFQHRGVVAPRQSARLHLDPRLENRGVQSIHATEIQTTFPFALHQTTLSSRAKTADIIVWPKPEAIDLAAIFQAPKRRLFEHAGDENLRTQSIDASRIRDYQRGDPRPQINWKLTAKRDKTTVIEPRDSFRERYELHLDPSLELWQNNIAFERMLRLVTTLVFEMSRRSLLQGITVGSRYFPAGSPKEQRQFLDALAVLQPSQETNPDTPPTRGKHLWILPHIETGIQILDTHPRFTEGQK